MAKPRFVLRYRGEGPTPDAVEARVAELPSAVVIDASPRMLLVESDPEELHALVDLLPDWVVAPEQHLTLPDTRKRPERAPAPGEA